MSDLLREALADARLVKLAIYGGPVTGNDAAAAIKRVIAKLDAALAAVPAQAPHGQRPVGGNAVPSSPSVDSSVADPKREQWEMDRTLRWLNEYIMRHPRVQTEISMKARAQIELGIAEDILKGDDEARAFSRGDYGTDFLAELERVIDLIPDRPATEPGMLGDSGQVMAGRDDAQNGAALPSTPDRNDLLAVGRAQSQHDAGGSRSSPASLPSTTEENE